MEKGTEFTGTKDDFLKSGWEQVIEQVEIKERHYYSSAFFKKSKSVEDDSISQIFELFAVLLFSSLNPDSQYEPFKNTDFFKDVHIKFFGEIVELITNHEIKSRVADFLWLRTKNYEMAEIAIDSYLASGKNLEDLENWTQIFNRFERAFQLASMLGKNKACYQKVLGEITGLIDRCDGDDPLYLSAELMRLLLERSEGDPEKYARFCEKLAVKALGQNDFRKAMKYFETQASWHFQIKDKDSARDSKIKVAETFEREAEFNLENRDTPYLMASQAIERAIEAYRRAGNSIEKIEELKLKLKEYQVKAVKELKPIPGASINISDHVINAQKAVSEKPFEEALKSLVLHFAPIDKSQIRQQVEENREKYIHQKLFPKKLYSSDGRSVAIQPAQGEEAVLVDMLEYASYNYATSSIGFIEPARSIIVLEHSARDYEFYDLLQNHPFIPGGREYISKGREYIIARGLNAGLNGDFLSAVHFLIPQIEESIRYVLIKTGIVPSSFEDKGIQEVYNLNRLLTSEKFTKKLEEIFGEDFIFDLRGVLIERFGGNLRNNMAHGLIGHNGFYSYASIYFWWLALRLYILPVLIKRDDEPGKVDSEA